MTRFSLMTILAAALLLAGCGGNDAEPEPRATVSQSGLPEPVNQTAVASDEGYLEENLEGQFRVFWPDGCSKLRVREQDSELRQGAVSGVEVTCARGGDAGLGCQVVVYNETTSGEPATPEMVAESLGDYISKLGVEIWRQVETHRHGREGVAAFCRETDGPRQVWIEGFIDAGRVFIAIAWGPDQGLYQDPQVIRFFDTLENMES